MPLGIIPATKYGEAESDSRPATSWLSIVMELPTHEPAGRGVGEQRLASVVSEHRAETSGCILEAVNAAIAQWAAGTPLPDDLTLIVARRAIRIPFAPSHPVTSPCYMWG